LALLSIIGLVLIVRYNQKVTTNVFPHLVCPKATYCFGNKSNTNVVTHRFVLKNQGSSSLAIQNVKTPRKCTTKILSHNIIKPGKEATLDVQLDLSGFRGPIYKKILVKSNDPHQPWLQLSLTGRAVEKIAVMPSKVSFLEIMGDVIIQKTVDILVKDPNIYLTLNKAVSDSPYFEPELRTATKGKSYQLNIRTVPPLPEGITNGIIRVLTDNKDCPVLAVPVKADVIGDLLVYPDEIVLSSTDISINTDKPYVVIISGKKKIIEITDVISPSPFIKTKVVPLSKDAYKIELNIPLVMENLNGRNLHIKVKTDMNFTEEIIIPFRCSVPLRNEHKYGNNKE